MAVEDTPRRCGHTALQNKNDCFGMVTTNEKQMNRYKKY
jgi:hypothetical protein